MYWFCIVTFGKYINNGLQEIFEILRRDFCKHWCSEQLFTVKRVERMFRVCWRSFLTLVCLCVALVAARHSKASGNSSCISSVVLRLRVHRRSRWRDMVKSMFCIAVRCCCKWEQLVDISLWTNSAQQLDVQYSKVLYCTEPTVLYSNGLYTVVHRVLLFTWTHKNWKYL